MDQDYRPGYPIEHAFKDLKLIESSAKELGISTLGMAEVIAVYEAAVQQGLAKKDIAAIAEVLPCAQCMGARSSCRATER